MNNVMLKITHILSLLQHLLAITTAWVTLMGLIEMYHHPYISSTCIIIAYALSLRFKLFIPSYVPIIASARYILWLAVEIFKSAIAVTKIVWQDTLSVTPDIISIQLNNMSPVERLLYAYSITLTPGTVVIEIDDKYLLVHVLDLQSNTESQSSLYSTLLYLQHKLLQIQK